MSFSGNPKRIPVSARPFFQEYNLEHLDVDQHAALVIERILQYGNRAEVRWLSETYGRDQIRHWLIQSGMSRLSLRRYHLWRFVFDLQEGSKPTGIWNY